jgi:hypothetical protein
MTADTRAAVLTARRAAQHFRLSVPHDAYEYLCILTFLPEPSPVSALCWQMHRLLTVLVSLLRVWVHCPRASNGPLPRRSNLVGYVQWDAQFDRFLLVKQSLTSSFPGHSVRWDARSDRSLLSDNQLQQLHQVAARLGSRQPSGKSDPEPPSELFSASLAFGPWRSNARRNEGLPEPPNHFLWRDHDQSPFHVDQK